MTGPRVAGGMHTSPRLDVETMTYTQKYTHGLIVSATAIMTEAISFAKENNVHPAVIAAMESSHAFAKSARAMLVPRRSGT